MTISKIYGTALQNYHLRRVFEQSAEEAKNQLEFPRRGEGGRRGNIIPVLNQFFGTGAGIAETTMEVSGAFPE